MNTNAPSSPAASNGQPERNSTLADNTAPPNVDSGGPSGAAALLGHIWKTGPNINIQILPNQQTLTVPIQTMNMIINSPEALDQNNEYCLSL